MRPLLSGQTGVRVVWNLRNHIKVFRCNRLPPYKRLIRNLRPENLRLPVRNLRKLQALINLSVLKWARGSVHLSVRNILDSWNRSRLRTTNLPWWPFLDLNSALTEFVDMNVILLVHPIIFGKPWLKRVIIVSRWHTSCIGFNFDRFFRLLDEIHNIDSRLWILTLIWLEIWWIVFLSLIYGLFRL